MEVHLFWTMKESKDYKKLYNNAPVEHNACDTGSLIQFLVFFLNLFCSKTLPKKKKRQYSLVIIVTPKLITQEVGFCRKTTVSVGVKNAPPNKLPYQIPGAYAHLPGVNSISQLTP